ncbi:MAG TPA: penicillin acylase family protein [Desulfobacteraceae bacterium]|nr:penicillin acylase family protein [Desulfobacteraceae bacterium]
MKKHCTSLVVILFGTFLLAGCAAFNDYRRQGELALSGLTAPVTVLRDEKGMAYIRAAGSSDAVMAQGFVTAQDRLFQMELNRRFAAGRISEFAGEGAVGLDTRMRTLGLYRNARRHAKILDPAERAFFQRYADGVNAYIGTCRRTLPLEFKLAGIDPEPWTVEDSLAILYLMAWDTSANIQTEIVTQALIEALGPEKAREIFPLNINPDDPSGSGIAIASLPPDWKPVGLGADPRMSAWIGPRTFEIGSNNWVTGPALSANGKPIVANDPHLDARILPGPWYPVGLITPEFRAVGANIAGIPGMVVGRTEHVAYGVTNAYGDMQDLYVETVDPKDPNRYLEGDRSLPFEIIEETLRIRDKKAPDGCRSEVLRILATRRGPVVSGVLKGLNGDRCITMRFAPFETMHGRIGLDRFLTARSVDEFSAALRDVNMICLNLVVADTAGNFAWRVTGTLPRRAEGSGTVPWVVRDGRDNWQGWIPFEDNPHLVNPAKGWLGTCNHTTVTQDLPYYYSSYFSPSFRYRRLKELMDRTAPLTALDHWQFQRDTRNLLAVRLAPVMAKALTAHDDTRRLGEILAGWNFQDDIDQAAPTIFQAVLVKFAFAVFEDELGPELAALYLDNWYIWEERLLALAMTDDSEWFDDRRTEGVRETRDDLLHRAALTATAELTRRMGSDPDKWLWGTVHRLELVSPIRRKGFGKGLLGGGAHPAPGSNETLCRGWWDVNTPFDVTHSAALRMVADLADGEKILAVQPGGVTGRIFHPHHTDQVDDYFSGKVRYWWFSDAAIEAHAKNRLTLRP